MTRLEACLLHADSSVMLARQVSLHDDVEREVYLPHKQSHSLNPYLDFFSKCVLFLLLFALLLL